MEILENNSPDDSIAVDQVFPTAMVARMTSTLDTSGVDVVIQRDVVLDLSQKPVSLESSKTSSSSLFSNVVRSMTTSFDDPDYLDQWHLDKSFSSTAVVDIDAVGAWDLGYTGYHIPVVVNDNGLRHAHPDFLDTYSGLYSYDYEEDVTDPSPSSSTIYHGTACAGLISAGDNNGSCGVGVAYESSLSGRKVIYDTVTTAILAEAIQSDSESISVSSNSYGPSSCGESGSYTVCINVGHYSVVNDAFDYAIQSGRSGLGTLVFFSSGNDQDYGGDASLYFTTYPYVFSIGAIGANGKTAPYSNPGEVVSLVAPSNGYDTNGDVLSITTDGYNGCISSFGGTSAAAPIAAGVGALVLSVNENLSLREVFNILIHSALLPPDPYVSKTYGYDSYWKLNPSGMWHNRYYGFGVVNAKRAVILAEQTIAGQLPSAIMDGTTDTTLTITAPDDTSLFEQKIYADDGDTVGVFEFTVSDSDFIIEVIELKIDADVGAFSDFEIDLHVPSPLRRDDDAADVMVPSRISASQESLVTYESP
ncbi:Peptidase S8, subtilisin-related like protein, partial [Aduncisulcus paluster]